MHFLEMKHGVERMVMMERLGIYQMRIVVCVKISSYLVQVSKDTSKVHVQNGNIQVVCGVEAFVHNIFDRLPLSTLSTFSSFGFMYQGG